MRWLEDRLLWWLLYRWRQRTTKEKQWEAEVRFALTVEEVAVSDGVRGVLQRAERLRKAQLYDGHDRTALVDMHGMPPAPSEERAP